MNGYDFRYEPGPYGQEQQQQFQPKTHRVQVEIVPRRKNKENDMSDVDDKVEVKNIFTPGYGSGGHSDGVGGLGAMAAIAALGNRNERGYGGYGGDGFGFGGGGLGALLAVALLGGRGFGGFDGHRHGGRDDGCCDQIGQQIILSKLGSIEGAIPLAAANTTNDILAQTNALQGNLASLALGTQQGFANVKDSVQIASAAGLVATAGVKDTVQAASGANLLAIAGVKDTVQNGFFATNTNLLEGLCSVKQVVNDDGDKTRALLTARFQLEDQTKIATQAAEIIELREEGRRRSSHDELKLQITNTNTAVAAQAQGQQQQQFQALVGTVNTLVPLVHGLATEFQIAKGVNSNVIVGNTGATTTGAQSNNPTNVRA